jgi:protein CpxP
MKSLAKISLLAAGLAVASASVFAADSTPAPTPAPAPGDHAAHPRLRAMMRQRAELRAHIAKRLDLTDAQKGQLKARRAETRTALQALRADSNLTQEQKRAKAKELVASSRTDLRSVLTPDQQAKLDQMRERVRKHRK